MANGWARDGAVQDQIEDSIRDQLAGARTCVPCQGERDKKRTFSGINRRGSKDSQLR